jgi:hypothetical protein
MIEAQTHTIGQDSLYVVTMLNARVTGQVTSAS